MENVYKAKILLLLVLVTGLALRLESLGEESLWFDELETHRRSDFKSLGRVIEEVALTEFYPPAYHILMYYVIKYVGDTEYLLRLPSALAGTLAIYVMFLVGRRLYSIREGLISAALIATLWIPVHYSQEARSYAFLLLFTLSATYYWLKIMDRDLNKATIAGYVITSCLSGYFHYFGLFLTVLQGTYAFIHYYRSRYPTSRLFLTYFMIFALFIPWMPSMWYQKGNNAGSVEWIPAPGLEYFPYFIEWMFNNSWKGFLLVMTLYTYLIAYELRKLVGKRSSGNLILDLSSPDLITIAWLVIPFTITFLASTYLTPMLNFRYVIISIPAAYLLFAHAITLIPSSKRTQNIIAIIIICLFLSRFIFTMGYYSDAHKEQYRDAVAYTIKGSDRYEDAMVIGYSGTKMFNEHFDYYFENLGSDVRIDVMGGRKADIMNVSKSINARKPSYIWMMRGHSNVEPEFLTFLNETYTHIKHQGFVGADVWLYKT
ncbi:glycosyltransferase family 39 protein [Candidatus Altiarchaeota archaeon]